MSDEPTNGREPTALPAASQPRRREDDSARRETDCRGAARLPAPLRIQIDVPLGTSYLEIQASIFRQAWQLAGTQLRAAVALGITPDTISRVLKRCERLGLTYPPVAEGWREVTLREPPTPRPSPSPAAGDAHPGTPGNDVND